MSSFRVRGKIFATVPAGGGGLHVFMDELEAAACGAETPPAYAQLWGGRRVWGGSCGGAGRPAGSSRSTTGRQRRASRGGGAGASGDGGGRRARAAGRA